MSRIDIDLSNYPSANNRYPVLRNDKLPEIDFMGALTDFGLIVQGAIENNKIVRVGHVDKPNKKTGWYLYFGLDPVSGIAGGVFGDWRYSDDRQYWSNKQERDVTADQWARYQKRVAEQKVKADAEKQRRQNETAKLCQSILAHRHWINEHGYLTKKRVLAHGVYQDDDGALLVPLRNNRGELRNLQKIYPNSNKYFTEGGQVKQCYHLLGSQLTTPTYIAEGYATAATVYEATGCAVVVTFNTGNLLPAAMAIREHYPDIPLTFAADNDRFTDGNPGIACANKAAKSIGNALVRVPEFSTSTGTDFNDLFISSGHEVVLAQLTGQTSTDRARGVQISKVGDVDYRKKVDWLIECYFVNDSLACIYGPSGSGKSFVALDFGLSVATGRALNGCEIKRSGPVLYICGEGQAGVARRIAAWCHSHEESYQDVEFYLTNHAVHFLDGSQLTDLIEKIRAIQDQAGQQFVLIIIDTLNRCFGPGDENRTDDMSQFVNGMDAIRRLTGGTVVVVHHTGLADTSRARGSSALRASLDTELEVKRADTDAPVRLLCRKQKDGQEARPRSFDMVPVTYARDVDNNPLGSIVLEQVDDTGEVEKIKPEPDAKSPRGVTKAILCDALANCDNVAKSAGKPFSECPNIESRVFSDEFRQRWKALGKRNISDTLSAVLGSAYLSKWVNVQGSMFIINREKLVTEKRI